MSASNYAELKLLDHLLGTAAFTMPTATYVKLHVGDPGEDCTANPAAETTREDVTFAAATGGTASATGTPVATWASVSTAETYTHVSIWDAITGGNPLAYGAMSSSVTVSVGGDFELTNLVVTLN